MAGKSKYTSWRKRLKLRANYLGIVFAVIALLISLLPSLLPRPWLLQGFISGLSMSLGYGLGLALSSSYRWFMQKELSLKTKDIAWQIIKYVAPVAILLGLIFGRIWQNQVRELISVEPIGILESAKVVLCTLIFLALFIKLGQATHKMGRKFNGIYAKRVPIRVSVLLGFISSFVVVYLLVSGVLFNSFLYVADSMFGARDNTVPEGIIQPQEPSRSGSPKSLIAWDKIGFQGRGFVGSGPTKDQITEYSKDPAKEPIRVYAGLASSSTAQGRADLALAELKRTRAFDRKVLVVATPTGTGWLDPTVMDPIEFMYNGDTAIVSQQYSYLPSWISFLVDQQRAHEAGRVLYDTVIAEWSKLPENDRPKLIVYGLSLGSFGAQDAFSGVNDIRRSVDGALFTGTPNEAELWRTITDNRDKGSPEWQPIYKGGQSVKFASDREDIIKIKPPKDDTRILFLQHANDPVVWFSFDLIFNKPDWLNEPRGRAVSHQTRWYPVITFLQIGLDQAIAGSAPVGEGHYYTDTTTYAWAAVAPPAGWNVEKSDRLQNYINNEYKSAQSSSSSN